MRLLNKSDYKKAIRIVLTICDVLFERELISETKKQEAYAWATRIEEFKGISQDLPYWCLTCNCRGSYKHSACGLIAEMLVEAAVTYNYKRAIVVEFAMDEHTQRNLSIDYYFDWINGVRESINVKTIQFKGYDFNLTESFAEDFFRGSPQFLALVDIDDRLIYIVETALLRDRYKKIGKDVPFNKIGLENNLAKYWFKIDEFVNLEEVLDGKV